MCAVCRVACVRMIRFNCVGTLWWASYWLRIVDSASHRINVPKRWVKTCFTFSSEVSFFCNWCDRFPCSDIDKTCETLWNWCHFRFRRKPISRYIKYHPISSPIVEGWCSNYLDSIHVMSSCSCASNASFELGQHQSMQHIIMLPESNRCA